MVWVSMANTANTVTMATHGKYGKYGSYGQYGSYGNYSNSHYGNANDNKYQKVIKNIHTTKKRVIKRDRKTLLDFKNIRHMATIAVDFDGTIVTHEYPKIGTELPFATETFKMLIRDHHRLFFGVYAKESFWTRQ